MLPLKIVISKNIEPDQADFAFTIVALNNQFFQFLAIHFSIDYSVNVFGFVFRRYNDAATGAWEVPFSLNFGQVNLVHKR
jgi:hypothetical protein